MIALLPQTWQRSFARFVLFFFLPQNQTPQILKSHISWRHFFTFDQGWGPDEETDWEWKTNSTILKRNMKFCDLVSEFFSWLFFYMVYIVLYFLQWSVNTTLAGPMCSRRRGLDVSADLRSACGTSRSRGCCFFLCCFTSTELCCCSSLR